MTAQVERDQTEVGDGIHVPNAAWSFAGEASVHFDGHVSKSVPLYHLGHELVEQLSDFFIGDESVVRGIGCSTGALTERLAHRHAKRTARIIGTRL